MSLQQTHAPAEEQSINWETLKSRCIGRLDLVEKALNRFQDSLADDLESLEEAVEKLNSQEVARIAHRIKGTSLTVSADRLAGYAMHLERQAEEEDLNYDEASLADIRDECCRLSQLISQHRSGGS
ncbi:Hpt domain protein [Bremerella volcania]|uniref:Hpt domain protein n=1 Tax=Bremerella volcania TaxID=2527984 RepID=A0A518CE24_9BACT|nr:Hpt domain-containing protein [Bremerella volcania]QDU77468.1 Hpt domain protein [Bremerella volcania]